MTREDCIREYQGNYENKVRMYQSMFESSGSPYYHNLEWQRQVLSQAKTEFDNCMSLCQQEDE